MVARAAGVALGGEDDGWASTTTKDDGDGPHRTMDASSSSAVPLLVAIIGNVTFRIVRLLFIPRLPIRVSRLFYLLHPAVGRGRPFSDCLCGMGCCEIRFLI